MERASPLEGVMNLTEKPHSDAGYAVSSFHGQPPVFCIYKPFPSKSITPSRARLTGTALVSPS
jgi:hypothetical protein